jgi:predicted  nucleic acid-binding Zn-ribbon protein
VDPDLKTIIELQHVDSRIAELTAEINLLPAQVERLQAHLNDFIHAHEERKKRLATNLKERKDLEGEVKIIQEKISKHKDQLYQVKTNEQYRAMLKEIEGEEAKVRKIEDQILEKMIEAEDIQKKIQEAASSLEGERAQVASETGRLESQRQADIEERDRLQVRREELAGALSEAARTLYERIRSARRGVALAEVRNGLCTACNVLLRPQVYNEVRMGQGLLTCDNCSRIIYYVEPLQAQTGDANDQGAEAAV